MCVCVCGSYMCVRVSKMSITKAQHMSNCNTKILNSYTELQIARMNQAGFTIKFLILAHSTTQFTFIFFVALLLNLSVYPSLAEATFYVTISYFPYIATPAKGRPLTPPVEYVTETNLTLYNFVLFQHQLYLTLKEECFVNEGRFSNKYQLRQPATKWINYRSGKTSA